MIRRLAIILTVLAGLGSRAADEPPRAYRDVVTTPHWDWAAAQPGDPLRVLFLTSFLGGREPDELAQRFDIAVDTVPVSANPSAIPDSYDEDYLAAALARRPDLIVVSYRGAWGKLSAAGQQALVDAVSAGTPLIAISAGGAPDALREEALPADEKAAEAAMERNLAYQRLTYTWGRKGGRIGVTIHRCGAGRYLNVGMGHGAGGRFNAFIPDIAEGAIDGPPSDEIAYAIFGRLMLWATGRTRELTATPSWEGKAALGRPLPITFTLNQAAESALTLEWELRATHGERLTSGEATIAAGAPRVELALPLDAAGELTLLYRLRGDDGVIDFGAVALPVASGLQLSALTVPEFNADGEAVRVSWTVDGEPLTTSFALQIYDADGRLVARAQTPVAATSATVDGWRAQSIGHTVRLLALDPEGRVQAEARAPLYVQVDRSQDPAQFHVMAWATEVGESQDFWRYQRLRQLGVTALSPVGKGLEVPRMATAAGLRLAPVNVCVPPSRFKKSFDPAAERESLAAYGQAMAPLSPLGYSLADEPAGVDLAAFRDWAAAILQAQDPAAIIGYCGTHMKVGLDIPRILASCDFMIHYSPHYLYTSDLWRGIERDLHRAFTPPTAINSAYTHYVPWADHEPYSRVTPWLLLFEEANGISYFASAGGNFSILQSDLRRTHETRWWSQELRELQQGIATQLVAMQRDPGGVALLFPTNLPEALSGPSSQATTVWVKALRDQNIPYSLVSTDQLGTLEPTATPLLICPPMPELTPADLQALQRYVQAGGTLVATAPFGLYEPKAPESSETPFWQKAPEPPPKPRKPPKMTATIQAPAQDDTQLDGLLADVTLEDPTPKVEPPTPEPVAAPDPQLDIGALFGLKRAAHDDRESAYEALGLRARIPTDISWQDSGTAPTALSGRTAGQYDLVATAAAVIAHFPAPAVEAPRFATDALRAPAALRVTRGQGTAYYLNFLPDRETAAILAERFRQASGAAGPPAQVTVDGEPAESVYLYPLVDGELRAIGIIQDHETVKPAFAIEDQETALYYHHGPRLWAAQDATLTLPESAHVYDMRAKRYLGETASIDFTLQPGRAALFALLPYRVAGLELSAPDRVRAGESLPLQVQVVTDGERRGDHTVHLRFAPTDDPATVGFAGDLRLIGGVGTIDVPTAFNDRPGAWRLQVTDSLSGAQSALDVTVAAAAPTPGPALPHERVTVTTEPLDWPVGEWTPYVDPQAQRRDAVAVQVSPIARKRLNYGPFSGYDCLIAKRLIQLNGRRQSYQFTYTANNDWKQKGWQDQRRIEAHALSGLGMNRPAGHLWYYNGYIDVYFDATRVTGFRIADVTPVDAGADGRVDVRWESPAGEAVLSFGLRLDGQALLQQLQVRPTRPVETVRVVFRSYIGDFGQTSTRYVLTAQGRGTQVTDPAAAPWAFYADDVNDQAYGKGKGAGGILIRPEQWDRVRYGMTGELVKQVDLQAGESAAFQWALWLYGEATNEEAYDAFTVERPEVDTHLRTFFSTPDP